MLPAAKTLKSFFTFLGVTIFLFGALEISSYAVLRFHYHINPLEKEQAIYGRTISGYYVSRNTPNFTIGTFDGLHNFEPDETVTDSNGFITGGQVSKVKPPNTVRIFITGGSAAFGSIQNQAAVNDNTYPSGTYDYPSSIAGRLKAKLSAAFPGKNFEVVNAAVPMHLFHQGYLQYMALLHGFEPDVIINMDGHNDMASILTGMPFTCAEQQELNDLVMLKNKQPKPWPFTVFLFRYFMDRHYHAKAEKIALNDVAFDMSDYRAIEPLLVKKSATFMWLIDSYEKQMRSDGVHSIFVLQPLLGRIPAQKKLSPLERKLSLNNRLHNLRDIRDSSVLAGIKQHDDEDFLKILGPKMTGFSNIVMAYYFDNYFSARADSIIKNTGGGIILI